MATGSTAASASTDTPVASPQYDLFISYRHGEPDSAFARELLTAIEARGYRAAIDERDFQYLFQEGDNFTFMDIETYDQISVAKDIIGDPAVFLQDGMKVSMKTHEGKPVSVALPQKVILEVVEADPVVKGQTAASSYKPAIMSNGVRVMVPPFITAGTKIVVNTEDSSYLERAKD